MSCVGTRELLSPLLDDALSAVDSKTEDQIRSALEARRGRRTTLVIAHRRETVAMADRIVVLDQGRVVQEGTHGQLAAVEGPYRRLCALQSAFEDGLADLSEAKRASGGQAT